MTFPFANYPRRRCNVSAPPVRADLLRPEPVARPSRAEARQEACAERAPFENRPNPQAASPDPFPAAQTPGGRRTLATRKRPVTTHHRSERSGPPPSSVPKYPRQRQPKPVARPSRAEARQRLAPQGAHPENRSSLRAPGHRADRFVLPPPSPLGGEGRGEGADHHPKPRPPASHPLGTTAQRQPTAPPPATWRKGRTGRLRHHEGSVT
jgi:hypothetical protein